MKLSTIIQVTNQKKKDRMFKSLEERLTPHQFGTYYTLPMIYNESYETEETAWVVSQYFRQHLANLIDKRTFMPFDRNSMFDPSKYVLVVT